MRRARGPFVLRLIYAYRFVHFIMFTMLMFCSLLATVCVDSCAHRLMMKNHQIRPKLRVFLIFFAIAINCYCSANVLESPMSSKDELAEFYINGCCPEARFYILTLNCLKLIITYNSINSWPDWSREMSISVLDTYLYRECRLRCWTG